jgi:hypothetical protein
MKLKYYKLGVIGFGGSEKRIHLEDNVFLLTFPTYSQEPFALNKKDIYLSVMRKGYEYIALLEGGV